jgi:protein TonB
VIPLTGKQLRPDHNKKENTMHFSDIKDGSGSKFTKIAIVAALHVAVGAALIHNMNAKVFGTPELEKVIQLFTPVIPVEPPPAPPEPPKVVQKTVTPPIVVPQVEVPVQTPLEPTVQAVVQTDATPTDPGPAVVATPTAAPSENTGAMRTAVLADANSCAKPDYPAKAARNNEAGTVTLALLVGPDGRVASSRVQRSSGFRELDKAAVSALSLCKFKPAMVGGVAEQAWAQLAYVWTLDS